MTVWTLIARSLRHHARSHAGTFLGVAVGSAILTGALLVGDSVRGSLRDLALARLGRTGIAVASGDRFFRSALARDLEQVLGVSVVPVMQLDATAATPDESARANRVQLLGVDERFWRLADAAPLFPSPGPDEVLLSEVLARQLAVRPGDVVLLRAARPSALSRETPLSPQEDSTLALRMTVCGLVPDTALGRFSLNPSQLPPLNAFLHLGTLQSRLELAGRANLLLVSGTTVTPDQANAALRKTWTLADAELELRVLQGKVELELRTPRVFLEPPTIAAVQSTVTNARPVLTYFVNELKHGDQSTPYSMVTAAGPPWTPPDLATNEIVLNDWLASDLQAGEGDVLELHYYALGTARQLEEHAATFRIRSVIPIEGFAADRELMPQFPGIEKADSTRDWDASLPISMARIRRQDEEYWKQHRGTPKAFVSLAAGHMLWTNRFGNLTAFRFPAVDASAEEMRDPLGASLLARLEPGHFGLRFEPVREQALASAGQSQDFGGLFLGFSFFLIVASLLLVGLLFQFGVERRAEEVGTLLALGFRPGQVRWLLLGEAGGLALSGSVVGLGGGVLYARAMIHGLSTLWRDAVGTSALAYHASPGTLAIGTAAGAAVALGTIAITLRRQARRPARELLAGAGEPAGTASTSLAKTGRRRSAALAWCSLLLGLMLVGQALIQGDTGSAGVFFGAGALGLIGGLAFAAVYLDNLARTESARRLTVPSLGIRNACRRRGRSLAVLGLLASGSFLVTAIGVFRLDASRDDDRRISGTGGFALVGEATFPVVQDLNTPDGVEFFALDQAELEGVSFVPLRVRDGDEASCLNLNRTRQPRLLGVHPGQLANRGSFTFAKAARGLDLSAGWELLRSGPTPEGEIREIPAIGDLESILWAMGRKVGDRLAYTDERGREFQVRIVGAVANSILQGNLLIDEAAFVSLFPSEAGYRMFLVDAPAGSATTVSAALTRALRPAAVEFIPASDRLAAFNAVRNTYLGTFQLLGGLGLVLGSIGLGVIVLRNVLERRGELALLLALGYQRRTVRRLVLAEHAGLLTGGLTLGMAAALVAVLPNVLSPASHVPYAMLGLTVGGAFGSGLVWTWLATVGALRGQLLAGLRNE